MFTADELAVITLKDGNANSIDLFFIDSFAAGHRGEAYPAVRNMSGNPNGSNFIVVAANLTPFTVGHEIMHILLNSSHRTGEPDTSLFFSPTSTTNIVGGTKRIGPCPDAETAGVGNDDTATIRGSTELLP